MDVMRKVKARKPHTIKTTWTCDNSDLLRRAYFPALVSAAFVFFLSAGDMIWIVNLGRQMSSAFVRVHSQQEEPRNVRTWESNFAIIHSCQQCCDLLNRGSRNFLRIYSTKKTKKNNDSLNRYNCTLTTFLQQQDEITQMCGRAFAPGTLATSMWWEGIKCIRMAISMTTPSHFHLYVNAECG